MPGLNPCIKAVVSRAEDAGMTVVGIRCGWGGLLNYNPDISTDSADCIEPLAADVRTIDRYGGTHLHTSRTNPAKVRPNMVPEFLKGRFPYTGEKQLADCTPHVLRALKHLGIDALIPIGGDDTLSFAVRLHQQSSAALESWLSDRGVQNIQALNEILDKGAKPWWAAYGGKENIELVDLPGK